MKSRVAGLACSLLLAGCAQAPHDVVRLPTWDGRVFHAPGANAVALVDTAGTRLDHAASDHLVPRTAGGACLGIAWYDNEIMLLHFPPVQTEEI